MLTPKDVELQQQFVARVVKFTTATASEVLREEVETSTATRLEVYRESFLGRAVSALTDAVLAPACTLFGTDVVKELVARYFAKYPPCSPYMVRALEGLPKFLREWGEGEQAHELEWVLRLCLAHETLLNGADPVQNPIPGTLKGPAKFFPALVAVDLFELWKKAQEVQGSETESRCGVRGILFVKQHTDYVLAVPVAPGLAPLVQEMLLGKTVQEALGGLSEKEIEDLPDTTFAEFIRHVVQAK